MLQASPGKDQQRIVGEDLVELIETAQGRLERRIKVLRALEMHLALHAARFLRQARYLKTSIIVLGSFLATRIVSDNISKAQTGSSEPLILVVIIYTTLSVVIAILAGLDSAFKPGETATEMNFLKVRCASAVDEVERAWQKDVERPGVSKKALRNTDPLLEKLDRNSAEIEERLAQLGIPLAGGSAEQGTSR